MAEKKQHTFVSAQSGEKTTKTPPKSTGKTMKEAAPVGNATGLRVGAVILWLVAFGLEIVSILMLSGKMPSFTFTSTLVQVIALLVLDLVCVIVGAQLWKKANHIKPASEKNKLLFWLWNNMGVIACIIAFVPFIVLILINKELDKQTKVIAAAVAAIALIIGGISGYDFNPVSAEQKEAAMEALADTTVYWSSFGKVYHTDSECHALNRSDSLTYGSVEEAIAASRSRLCSYCAKRDEIAGVVTDKGEDVVDEVENEVEDLVDDVEDAEDAA